VRVFTHRAFSAATTAVGLIFLAMFGSLFALTSTCSWSTATARWRGLRALPFGFA